MAIENIEKVRDNLVNTIAGKEKLRDILVCECERPRTRHDSVGYLEATVKFLEINIKELKTILADVEACLDKH